MKHVFPLNKRFRQIIKLSRLCDKHNIPYDMKRFMDGWALSIPNNESELCCVTQHSFSEGGKKNLLEIEFYIGGYESKGNQSAEEILSQLRKVQKYEDTKKKGMHRIQKYFASDDETMVTRDYEILKEYLDFRKENDEWFVVQIKDLGAVGIPNLPLFFPSWCNNITIKKDGYTQKVENIDWTVKENIECIESHGIFLTVPYHNKITAFPVKDSAYSSILNRADDFCPVMLRTKNKNSKLYLPANERAERLCRDFTLQKEACKVLYRDGKIVSVLSKNYSVLETDQLLKVLERKLQEKFPRYLFDKAVLSNDLTIVEYLLNETEIESKIRRKLNESSILSLKFGVRFATSDTGESKVYASIFCDINNARVIIDSGINMEHKGDISPKDFKEKLENIDVVLLNSVKQIQKLSNITITDFAETLKMIVNTSNFLPKLLSDEVIEEITNYSQNTTALNLYIALNRIIECHIKMNESSATRNMVLYECMTKLMYLDYENLNKKSFS